MPFISLWPTPTRGYRGPGSAGALLPPPPLPLPGPCDAASISAACLGDLQSCWVRPRSTLPQQGTRWLGCCPLPAPHVGQATGLPGSSVRRCHGWARPGCCHLQKPAPKLLGCGNWKAPAHPFIIPSRFVTATSAFLEQVTQANPA